MQLHVAPWGNDDGPGTADRPFASLARAQRAARARSADMDADVIVNIHAGTYVLRDPIEFRSADSGTNGHRVIYQAHGYGTGEQESVVVSGGREITGWRPHDPERGIWRAEVGDLEVRQLFADGRRVPRAALSGPAPGTWTRTESGYTVDSPVPRGWAGAGGIELVYRPYPWSEARLPVAEISGDEASSMITMCEPAFGWARDLYRAVIAWEDTESDLGPPISIENSLSFLTEPGSHVFDRSRAGDHVLYYLGPDPREGHVVASAPETLVRAENLRDLTLRGLTFSHATWLRPGRPEGFLHYHADSYYDGGTIETHVFPDDQGSVAFPGVDAPTMPANLTFSATTRVTLEGNRFSGLGGGAVAFRGDVGTIVRDNVFHDISGGAVAAIRSRAGRIQNNHVHHIGCEFRGSAAIQLTETQHTTVAHNQVNDVPHCGIIVNGGPTSRGAVVANNLVFNTMNALADGGGLYITGRQGTSFADGAVASGNVIHDTLTHYNFGLYTDYGATWVAILGNVVYRSHSVAILEVSPPLDNVAFLGNFWDDQPYGVENRPETVTLSGNTVLSAEDFEKALQDHPVGRHILSSAGPRPAEPEATVTKRQSP